MTVGVQIPRSQRMDPEERGTPLTVSHATLAFMVPTQWYDNEGRPHKEFAFVVGNTVYRDPRGEDWAASVKTFKAEIADEIRERCHTAFAEEVIKVVESLGLLRKRAVGHDDVDVLAFADETDRDVTAPTK